MDQLAMTVFIQSTANVSTNGIKCLVYGPPKVGKTRLMATAPAPIIFSAEAGLLSLRTYNLPYVQIQSMAHLQECYNWTIQSREAQQFATIGLDSISEIIEVLLEYEKTRTRDPRKAYGAIIDQGLRLIRDFRDLPGRNVVLIAKQETAIDGATGYMFNQPSFPGNKLGPAVPYYPDEIFQYVVHTDPQTRQRFEGLRCWADGQNVAGDRSGALDQWEPPNLTHIFTKIASGHIAQR
jgi:AAA domain-containing protein